MHKKVFKLLALQVLFLFISFTLLSFPSNSYASSLIGTHLGEGDVGYQINIITSVLVPNGLEPGSPVTVMVPVTMLQPSQQVTVQNLANAVSGAGYFPIVRINGVCEDFSSETGLNAAQSVDVARSIFGPDALIVWGNEINNKENECANWGKYKSDFEQIKGKPNVSPAALDYYMGLDAYKVSTMFAETPGMAELFNSSPRAANAYGCIGQTAEACQPLETVTQQTGYEAVNGTLYLTEFSLSPGGGAADAPDTNITKVLEFIANRAGETGAVKVTPLVRNVCNNESDWLLYINGKLFTPQGTEVSENCEGTSGGSYDLSIYPEYDADETMFYLSPIRNVIDSGTLQRTTEKLRKELALQGYQAYCATEGVKIEPEYDTQEKISKYLEQYSEPKILEMDAVETLNMAGAQYPLWRDVTNKQFLLTSLEEYFGFRDVYVAHPSETILRSSPINSLLTEPQLCVQGWRNLVAQQLACERLTNPGECELLTRKIPQLAFSSNTNAPGNQDTVITLLDKLSSYEPKYREGTAVEGCKALTTTDRTANQALLQGLINTPTYFDRSYRYGFLVAVIHSKDPGTSSGNIATKIFNFFTNKTRSLTPRDEVLVAAFKIPDIGTNKGGGDDTGSQFWSDPLDLTRKLLQTNEKNKTHEDVDRPNKRQTILDQAVGAATQGVGSKIYCADGNNATSSCQNELTKALTDIINGSAEGCGDAEVVSVIKDIAGLDNPEEPYGKVFNADNGKEVMLNLFFDDLTHPELGSGKQTNPQVAKTDDPAEKLKSLFTISNDTWSPAVDSTTADFYIVYPMGFELNAVETAMKSAFFTKAQLTALETQNTVAGFQMTGQEIGLSSGSVGFSYPDKVKTAAGECGYSGIDPITQQPIPKPCDETEVSITVSQDSANVGILGGSLGFWMRKIQLQLNTRTSDAWKYFDSCKTTEEFLLGKCTGGGIVAGGDELDSVAQCNGGPRITSGETAEHVDTTGTGACVGKLTRLYVPGTHNISAWKSPGDAAIDCEDLYSYADCTYPESLVQNPVNSEGKFVTSGNTTACEFVVSKAKELGVSPRLALAMWGEESGFSHYRVADLGVISQPAQDLGAQVTVFANTLKSYSSYLEFLEAYSGEERGSGDPSPNQFCNNPNFVGRLKTYYDFLGPR
ncbi:hypothetical protein KA017_03190 [Candidatus Woesebacteria bacterium]|nr:hypothetical protein [Candidatus Woesebacteria bacterium]